MINNKLIDTHCHLNLSEFENDLDSVVERAFSSAVSDMVICGSNLENSQKAVEIANRYPNHLYASTGLHPHDAQDVDWEKFKAIAQNEKVVAIGEAGLDYFSQGDIKADFQKELFIKQLKIALELNKPLVIHCRDAYSDMISLLISEHILPKGVMHCYLGDLNTANLLIDMGFLLSFTGIITFSKNQELLKVVREVPLGKIMIETDAPYLAPEKYRGKRNEPAFVREVAQKIAEIKKLSYDQVADQTTQNAKELFGI